LDARARLNRNIAKKPKLKPNWLLKKLKNPVKGGA
jgi:hypothetical protein